jgi:hypothetical protein
MMPHPEIRLTIPSEPEYLRLARLAAADAGSRVGLDVEEIEDLRIGVDELCYALLSGADGRPLTVVFSIEPGAIRVRGECPTSNNGDVIVLSELAASIVKATVDEHELDSEGGANRFRVVKRVSSSA